MKSFKSNIGIFILLMGVLVLCLQGFNIIRIYGNIVLVSGFLLMVIGLLVYILMNKKSS